MTQRRPTSALSQRAGWPPRVKAAVLYLPLQHSSVPHHTHARKTLWFSIESATSWKQSPPPPFLTRGVNGALQLQRAGKISRRLKPPNALLWVDSLGSTHTRNLLGMWLTQHLRLCACTPRWSFHTQHKNTHRDRVAWVRLVDTLTHTCIYLAKPNLNFNVLASIGKHPDIFFISPLPVYWNSMQTSRGGVLSMRAFLFGVLW